MKPTPEDLLFLKTDDLLMIQLAIDFYSRQKNDEQRIYFGNLYNRVGRIHYLAKTLDERPDVLAYRLAELENEYSAIKQNFKTRLGKDYRFIQAMRDEHFKAMQGN